MKKIVQLSGKHLIVERRFSTELNQHDEENDKGGEKEKDSCARDNSREILRQSKSRSKEASTRARDTLLQLPNGDLRGGRRMCEDGKRPDECLDHVMADMTFIR